MRTNDAADLSAVRAVYEGVQAELYELFMGQQIHVGGYESSRELAEFAEIREGLRGIELCCGSGASMRLLVRAFGVASMVGVELATAPVDRGRRAVEGDGLVDQISFQIGDATETGLPTEAADFIWGEDAWCYVPDKDALVREAARLTRPGGVIAFTDWVEGHTGLSQAEAQHVMQIMTFPTLQSIDGYVATLDSCGLEVVRAEDTQRFGPSFELYADLLRSQLAFDALEKFDFNTDLLAIVIEQLQGFSRLGHEQKLVQGRFVARKR